MTANCTIRPSSAARDPAEVRRADLVARLAEARLVEQVERFDPELHALRAAASEMFLKSDRSVRAKPGPRTLSRGVEPGSRGVGKRAAREARGVEPLSTVCGAPSFGSQVWSGRFVR